MMHYTDEPMELKNYPNMWGGFYNHAVLMIVFEDEYKKEEKNGE
jgi:hypothetical protein